MTDSTNVEVKDEGQKQVDIEKVMQELNEVRATNERLLNESKEWKSKYQSSAKERENIEKAKLEKEGNFQELLEKEKSERLNLEKKLKDRESSLLKTQARALLAEYAKDAHDIGDLLRLDEVSSIQYDEENLSVVKESVKDFVSSIREKKPWMFGEKNIPSSTDGAPSSNVNKSFTQMTSKEKEAAMKASFANILKG